MAGEKKNGESKGEAKKKKKFSPRKCRAASKWGLLVLFLAAVPVVPYLRASVTDLLVLGFLTLRYHAEGVDRPLHAAFMDGMYFRSANGNSLVYDFWLLQHNDYTFRQMLNVEPGDDHIRALCKVSMYTQMVTAATWVNGATWQGEDVLMPPGMFNLDTHDPVPTQERVNAYLQACIEVYNGLDKEGPQRKILDKLEPVRKPEISTPKVLPASVDIITAARTKRATVAAERGSNEDNWKPLEDIPEYGYMYGNTRIRPVKEEYIEASQIGDAVRNGKVAVFDATKLLGKEIFNMSMVEIADLHKDTAAGIPMYRQKGAMAPANSGVDNLKEYAQKVRAWKSKNAIRYPENAPWRPDGFTMPQDHVDWADAFRQPTKWLDALANYLNCWFLPFCGFPLQDLLKGLRSQALQCAVNTRRLPKLPMPKIEDALGNPDWLERAWTMFWLGPVSDCWHYDDPDNLLIGIYGDIWVTVFMLEDRELMRAGGDRGCWSPLAPLPSRIDSKNTQATDSWLEGYKFIHLKLTPGTGVTVPSGAFHSLTMTDGDRVLMNCFMIPKYKGLWDAPAANHSFYSSQWQSEEYHALSQLKKSSIFRLWDTKKLGGYFEGTKLEML